MTYGHHRAVYVTRKANEIWDETTTRDRIQRKPGWMFWGSFAGGKKGPCLFWEKEWGTINAASYQISLRFFIRVRNVYSKILIYARIVPLIDGWVRLQRGEGNLLSYEEDERPIHLRLMQDNAPAHAGAATQSELLERRIEAIDWPPYSPDLNPIENCWNWMKDYQDKMWGDEVCSLKVERARISECWQNAVTDERLKRLIAEMPARCAAVVAANGGPTRW